MIELVPASPAHVGRIANRIRQVDLLECAAFGRSPKESLRLGLRASVLAGTALLDGEPIAMFGLTPVSVIEDTGRPWMLGTDAVPYCARALLTGAASLIDQMHARFSRLENVVAVENVAAVRMLQRWGFTVEQEVMTVGGVEMVGFWRKRDV